LVISKTRAAIVPTTGPDKAPETARVGPIIAMGRPSAA